jgi:3D-(3,5/4)-trihydroxycyclohexane-1,2-dione acylhydrolase (decyclizing)
MTTVRLTMAQALVRYLMAQRTVIDGQEQPLIPGVWAIFGHGNVAGLGEALYHAGDRLPTYRGHNEQAMALAAIAFAKEKNRRQFMACTSSIGPGATNMVTAAALAHANRLPVLLLPGDVFANRRPDPVLQQIEDFGDPTISANDCFRPVSRFWDRIVRPEQLLTSLPHAIETLVDPSRCGPATLSLCQDVQAEAFDYPEAFFEPRVHHPRRIAPDEDELASALDLIGKSQRPLIIAGGGVHYSDACGALAEFADNHGIPVAETQAGKGALIWDHGQSVGAIGVTGSSAANALAADADLVLAVGTRLQDFTSASRSLFKNPAVRLIQLNVASYDSVKHGAVPLVCDARRGIEILDQALADWRVAPPWQDYARSLVLEWNQSVDSVTAPTNAPLPSDAQVLGAVNRTVGSNATLVCAAGGLPGELHKLWRTQGQGAYHVEYGFSCMGYEIAGGVGVKMARPDRDVVVMVGDGSYLMMNSEIATSVMLGLKLIIVVLDNRGFGCINRLQQATGSAPFNNLLADARHQQTVPIDFASHAASLGAIAEKVSSIAELEQALVSAADADRTQVIVIDTDPMISTEEGGAWWDVAVPEVSDRTDVQTARAAYESAIGRQR